MNISTGQDLDDLAAVAGLPTRETGEPDADFRTRICADLRRIRAHAKERAVLTWDEAAALWVEWGGRHRPAQTVTDEITMCARLTGKGAEPYVWPAALGLRLVTVVGEGVKAVGCEYSDGDLTADTLEDMAEACGLPRTPGRLWAVVKERFRRRRPLTSTPSRPKPTTTPWTTSCASRRGPS